MRRTPCVAAMIAWIAAFPVHAAPQDCIKVPVALWGDGWPLGVDRAMTRTQHVLSAAARRFKGYALAAAGLACGTVDPTETLLCDMATCSPVGSELVRL